MRHQAGSTNDFAKESLDVSGAADISVAASTPLQAFPQAGSADALIRAALRVPNNASMKTRDRTDFRAASCDASDSTAEDQAGGVA
jgi:hypothetical protein